MNIAAMLEKAFRGPEAIKRREENDRAIADNHSTINQNIQVIQSGNRVKSSVMDNFTGMLRMMAEDANAKD